MAINTEVNCCCWPCACAVLLQQASTAGMGKQAHRTVKCSGRGTAAQTNKAARQLFKSFIRRTVDITAASCIAVLLSVIMECMSSSGEDETRRRVTSTAALLLLLAWLPVGSVWAPHDVELILGPLKYRLYC